MGRVHLFEFCDQPWLPRVLRLCMTEYLAFVEERSKKAMATFVPKIQELVGSGREVVDLCSGPAGPWRVLRPQLAEVGCELEVTLTDISPTPEYLAELRGDEGLRYVEAPVDATAVPAELRGPRVMFNGLHHFKPEDARRILSDAMARREPIGVFEMISRKPAHVLTAPLIFVIVLLVTPFVRPFRWSRLLFTYLVPVAPLLIMWDGWVSSLRVYSTDELARLVAPLGADYEWEIGEIASLGPGAPYLIGRPRAGNGADAGAGSGGASLGERTP